MKKLPLHIYTIIPFAVTNFGFQKCSNLVTKKESEKKHRTISGPFIPKESPLRDLLANIHEKEVGEVLEQKLQELKEYLTTIDKEVINEKDTLGNTHLFFAVSLRKKSCIELLLAHGANPDLRSSFSQTILHPLLKPNPHNLKQIDSDLLNELCQKVSLDTINGKEALTGSAPIHAAAIFNNKLLKVLIEHGADLNIQDDANNTPVHLVITKYNHPSEAQMQDVFEGVKLLCEHKNEHEKKIMGTQADLNATNSNKDTPLHLAI